MFSDATLTVLSNKNNPIVEVRFSNLYPVSLGALEFNQGATDVEYITVQQTSHIKLYEIRTMTKQYYEMHSVQKTPISYKTGKNSGIIFITMWNSLHKQEYAKNCRGAWSVGKFPDYPSVTFRFFEDADIEWWNNYLIEINHTI